MAAGDYRFKLVHLGVNPGDSIVAEYRFGVEAKDGSVDGRGETLEVKWADLTASQKSALQDLAADLKAKIKAGVPKLATALDLS